MSLTYISSIQICPEASGALDSRPHRHEHAATPLPSRLVRYAAYLRSVLDWNAVAHEPDEIDPVGKLLLGRLETRDRK